MEKQTGIVLQSGILLNTHFVNIMQVGGELGCFPCENNPSTGSYVKVVPDNSGVYEVQGLIALHPSMEKGITGVPGMELCMIKAVRPGKGSLLIQRWPAGASQCIGMYTIYIEVH